MGLYVLIKLKRKADYVELLARGKRSTLFWAQMTEKQSCITLAMGHAQDNLQHKGATLCQFKSLLSLLFSQTQNNTKLINENTQRKMTQNDVKWPKMT
jgi:hypothetical protein